MRRGTRLGEGGNLGRGASRRGLRAARHRSERGGQPAASREPRFQNRSAGPGHQHSQGFSTGTSSGKSSVFRVTTLSW